ncbi:Fic family protein [Bradyrhizobium cenepequi]|uniref:Fic family protein n=1 Tax=Bradyrhizobium cenepequi TaxID=2821403 RepID=UPI001CE280C5|nr:Fic family protein [Bradyrhizobium cenepequi]MCA6111811.1 Fic family protein [Bradyrhizobium cenepequi]
MFQDRLLNDQTRLVGLAALVHALSVKAPVRRPSAVSEKHIRGSHRDEGGWRLYDKRYWAGENFADHLTFALRHESLDLLVLKRIFQAVPKAEIEAFVKAAPTGVPTRRVWFLYEFLTGDTLDVSDTPNAAAVDLLDEDAYFTGKAKLSKRHRVRDNLLGTNDFTPMIRKTPALVAFTASGLAAKASDTVGRTGAHVVSRAANFLLLADSRASFAIEGERPPRNRLERWGRAVIQAGRHPLTVDEIVRLHGVLIEDTRLIHPGIRPDGVFLGERDHDNNPLPEFIGARPDDLDSLMRGLIKANARMRDDGLDPVLQAAATAFGFVYVHPFQDGNGRLHRCLIHHVLAERKFTPPGMVFPVSSVMLDRIDDYRTTLQSHSTPLMEFIDWRPTPDRNVEVLNDTADLYRYYDCTEEAEFLYGCVKRTVEYDLPHEIDYLRRHDEARRSIMEVVEMPDRLADDLLLFIRQNNGTLSRKRREREFEALSDKEVAQIEKVVQDAFDGFETASHE